jgi:hypothetical protein
MSTKRALSLQRGLAQAGAGRSELHTLIGRGTGRDTHALSGGEGMGSLNLTSPCSLLPVHSLHCERTAHRTLLLRTLGPMGDQVLFHDLLSEAKDLRFLRIDDGPHPAISGDLLSAVISIRYILGFRKDNPNVFNMLVQNLPHC